MSSFPSTLSTPQKTTARTSGYWARVFACLNDNDVVFRAQAAESITDEPFITFDWDNADIGAYTDVWEGMVAFISETTSIREAKYRGRVRLAPSASAFYIDRNATELNDGDYIIVVRDVDLFDRIRQDTLVDGSIAYHDLPPMLAGLPSCIVLYDADDDGTVTFTPDVEGVPVDVAATVVDTWAWSVSGDGTNSIDDDTLQNPEFTFQAGYHYLIRVVYEDDNGVSNYQVSHVYAVTRTFDAPVVRPVVVGGIDGGIEDGWTASLTAYADVSTLADRTHVGVFAVEHFGDNSSTPLISNVLMSGRIRSSSIRTEGSAEAGQLQQVTFTVEGITAYLRRLNIPNDIVRTTATPNEWGEGIWNPYRMAVYAMWAYTTLTNICSFSVETGAFEDWQIGGEPRGIDGGKILDVLTGILEPIRAAPNFAPSGEIHLARTVSYQADRSGVETIMTFELQDIRDLDIDVDSSRTTSQVVGYGGSYNSDANTFVLYQAHAPTIVYGEGDTRELTREILAIDSTVEEAQDELEGRVSNDYAFHNSKALMRLSLFDSFAGILIPTNYQRWAAVIPASANTLGKAYSATDYWQLQSVSLSINTDGSIDVSGEWYAETTFSGAQSDASLLPDNLSNMNPVLPVLPNEPAFPTDPLENYPTDTPALEDLQPIDPESAAQAYTPFPPDVAAQVANKQGKANCNVLQPLFSNSSNTESSWLTVNTAPYLITLSGFAALGNVNGLVETYDFTASDHGFVALPTTNPYAIYYAGEGWGRGTEDIGRLGIQKDLTAQSYTRAVFTYNEALTNGFATVTVYPYPPLVGIASDTSNTDTVDVSYAAAAGFSCDTGQIGVVLTTTLRLTTLALTRQGTSDRLADAFYSWTVNEDGEEIDVQALGPTEGLFIDNALYVPAGGIPPFNKSHRYENLAFTGTGNIFRARMVFASYTDVQRTYLTIEVCRQV